MSRKEKISYLKFRNRHGQVLVAYKYMEEYNYYSCGFAFCSPEDFCDPDEFFTSEEFKKERRRRVAIGQAISLGRMKKYGKVIDNISSVGLDGKTISDSMRHLKFREDVLSFLHSSNYADTGLKQYRSKLKVGSFRNWFIPFIAEEVVKVEESQEALAKKEKHARSTNEKQNHGI